MIDINKLRQTTNIVLGMCTLTDIKCKTAINVQDLVMTGLLKHRVIIECTLLPEARNRVLGVAYEQCPDFTHILFVDADQCEFGPQHLIKLIEADKDIISGLTRRRNGNGITISPLKDIDTNINAEEIIECQYVGTFFTLVKREVFDAIGEPARLGKIWFNADRWPRRNFWAQRDAWVNRKAREIEKNQIVGQPLRDLLNEGVDLGMNHTEGTEILGEDITFCWRAREHGFSVWCHTGVQIGHIGEKIQRP